MGKVLFDKFILPPFSVFDTRHGYWQDRKRKWKEAGDFVEDSTRDSLVFDPGVSEKGGHQKICSVGSLLEFDPVLAEMMYRWFVPKDGIILDPTCGGPVRGLVATQLGYKYIGIDLRPDQIELNEKKLKKLGLKAKYIAGDGADVANLVKEDVDFVFSCPPYFDLEVYSDQPQDLSNMASYGDFVGVYEAIIKGAVSRLKPNRFACFVVGNIRDKDGFYHDFVGDTVRAFEKAGARYYNEAILMNVVGSVSLRVNRQFGKYRKLGKLHQNVLVFYKGDVSKIPDVLGEVDTTIVIPDNQTVLF